MKEQILRYGSLHAGGWMVEKKNGIRNEVAILNSRGQVWAG